MLSKGYLSVASSEPRGIIDVKLEGERFLNLILPRPSTSSSLNVRAMSEQLQTTGYTILFLYLLEVIHFCIGNANTTNFFRSTSLR